MSVLDMEKQVLNNGRPAHGTPLWRLNHELSRLPATAKVLEVYAGDVLDVCDWLGDAHAKNKLVVGVLATAGDDPAKLIKFKADDLRALVALAVPAAG